MSNNENAAANHFYAIDWLRAFAAITVCFYHFTYGFLLPEHWLRWFSQYGYLGVQCFFLISGFIIPYSFEQKDYKINQFFAFIKKRAIRIEPAYWVSIVLMLLMDLVGKYTADGTYVVPDHNVSNTLLHVTHLNFILGQPWIRDIYWTLAIDWQFFLLMLLSYIVFSNPSRWIRYAALFIFVALHWFVSSEWLFYHSFAFAVGLCFYFYYTSKCSFIELLLLIVIILVATYQAMGITHFMAIAGSAAVVLCCNKMWSWASNIGKISYSIYLTHVFSGWAVCELARLLTQNQDLIALSIFFATAVSIFFAKYFYDFVEAPTQSWSRK